MFKDIFGDNPGTRILDFLADHPESEYSITEIVEKSEISRPTVYKIIENLIKIKLISKSRTVGNAPLYKLNTENKLVRKMLKFDFEISKQIAELESQSAIKEYQPTLVRA
jgi:predicted transcriptional regulator